MFFHAYMYGPLQGKLRLYGARGIPPGSIAMSSDWEVFASMLVKDVGRKMVAGIDLANYEVKSAKRRASYEYQYHKKTGLEKLLRDAEVGHLFFEYFENLEEVHLRYLHGSQLVEFFTKWRDKYPQPYPQRYRKNVPYGFVKRYGIPLMTIKNGEVVFPLLVSGAAPVSIDAREDEEES